MSSERTLTRRLAGLGEYALSRRDFLRLGGVGLAGVTLLGASACGSGGENSGNVVLYYWEGIPQETQ